MKGVLSTVLALCAVLQCAQSQSQRYRATVVEYKSVFDEANTILKNVQYYVEEIERSDTQIIVFPEYGLTTIDVFTKSNWKKDYTLYVPKTYDNTILCEASNHVEKALKDISCAAKTRGTNVVINFLEKDNSSNTDIFYNTNLVFDNTGKIAAKYRKINLYEEDELTPGKDIVTFQSSFGVKFGIFTCYDILFKNPALDILSQDVNDIIYPTAWISQTPFGVSLSVQAGYAKKNKVNLLAANYNDPARSNGGSGIYKSRGFSAETYISGQQRTKALFLGDIESVALVKICPIDPREGKPNVFGIDSRGAGTIPTLKDYITKGISTEGSSGKYKDLTHGERKFKDEVCDGKICCQFEATITEGLFLETGKYKWALLQKDGAISCALVLCKTNEDASCGERIDEATRGNATFQLISIKGNFPKTQYTMPITSHVDFQPIYEYTYCVKDMDSNNEDISMEIFEGLHKDVTAFGIVGYAKGGADALWGNMVVVALLGFSAILRNYV